MPGVWAAMLAGLLHGPAGASQPTQAAALGLVTGQLRLAERLTATIADNPSHTRAENGQPLSPATRTMAGVGGERQVRLPFKGLVDLDALPGRLEKTLATRTTPATRHQRW
jgi:valyl-tRNA synthetase